MKAEVGLSIVSIDQGDIVAKHGQPMRTRPVDHERCRAQIVDSPVLFFVGVGIAFLVDSLETTPLVRVLSDVECSTKANEQSEREQRTRADKHRCDEELPHLSRP
jgi:hypothetical protein